MNRLQALFKRKSGHILNIYVTAGYPGLHDTEPVVLALDKAGVDIVELGIPYSDPLADGETIQDSSQQALQNGMTLSLLFKQIADIRLQSQIPIVLMGYFNQMLQYGIPAFIKQCETVGVDGLIIPDLPVEIYQRDYASIFEASSLSMSFLITPQTPSHRIRTMDEASHGFIYMVSANATTGSNIQISTEYFDRIKDMELNNPRLIGFGIKDRQGYDQACNYAHGAIIGSAFIKYLASNGLDHIDRFVTNIRNQH